jgi:hypothetical protein
VLSPRLKDIIILAREMQYRYELEGYTATQLKNIHKAMEQAQKEITAKLLHGTTEYQGERLAALLQEIQDLSIGIRTQLGEAVSTIAGSVSSHAADTHSAILSFDGAATAVETVALSAAQMAAFWGETPVGGYVLQDWVNRIFSTELKDKIMQEVGIGMLKGDSYKAISNRLDIAWGASRYEMETLVKTYVHTANIDSLKRVYEENKDLVQYVQWIATMEGPGSGGRGTCLRCAGLDMREFKRDEAPDCPLHPRCRCMLMPITKSFKELGLDVKDMQKPARPYTIREDGRVGFGGRKVLEAGRFDGSFGQWLVKQPRQIQINALGPIRYDLLKSGKIRFADLVDNAGRIMPLAELLPGVYNKFGRKIK